MLPNKEYIDALQLVVMSASINLWVYESLYPSVCPDNDPISGDGCSKEERDQHHQMSTIRMLTTTATIAMRVLSKRDCRNKEATASLSLSLLRNTFLQRLLTT